MVCLQWLCLLSDLPSGDANVGCMLRSRLPAQGLTRPSRSYQLYMQKKGRIPEPVCHPAMQQAGRLLAACPRALLPGMQLSAHFQPFLAGLCKGGVAPAPSVHLCTVLWAPSTSWLAGCASLLMLPDLAAPEVHPYNLLHRGVTLLLMWFSALGWRGFCKAHADTDIYVQVSDAQSLRRHLGHMSSIARLTLTQMLTAQVPEAPAVLLGTDGRRRKKITRRVGYARDADDDGLSGKLWVTVQKALLI